MDVGQTEIAALESPCELFVVKAELLQQGGVQIVDVNGIFYDAEAEFIGGAMDEAGFDAASCGPHGEGIHMVIASDGVPDFAHRSAPELAAPDHEGIIQQPSLFEIDDEGGAGLVYFAAAQFELFVEIIDLITVVIPVGVIELNKAHASFDESAGEQAIAGVGGFFSGAPVQGEGAFIFAREIHEFRRAGLHAVGCFVAIETGEDFRITGGRELFVIEGGDGGLEVEFGFTAESLRAAKVEDGIAGGAEGDSLKRGGEKSAAPQCRAGARAAWSALKDNESGQVAGGAAKSIGRPRSEGGAARRLEAGIHEKFGRSVIKKVGGHAAQPAHVVCDLLVMWKQVAERHPALAVLAESAA